MGAQRADKNNLRPSFVGIGMAKSGTSWLYSVLRHHPRIWMPPLKELHFFDDYYWLISKGDKSRYFAKDEYSRARWRRYLTSETRRALRFPSRSNTLWTIRFLVGRRDFNWYRGLFPDVPALIWGEITPAYSVLDRDDIQDIYYRYPWLKIILLLRNPVERAWSHAKMELASRRGRKVSQIQPEEWLRFLGDDGVRRRGAYSTIIQNWSRVFGRDKLFIGLYDQIVSQPDILIDDLCKFLNVPPERLLKLSNLSKVEFQGLPGEMPSDIRLRLKEELSQEIIYVAQYLGRDDLVERWQ